MSLETVGESATATHAGITVTSNSETEEQVREAIGAPSIDDETSEAASKLGKKGGAAAAEARKAKADAAEPAADTAKASGAADADDEPQTLDAAAARKGKPRHDPVARLEQLKGQIFSLAAERRAEEERLQRVRSEREAAERERQERPRPQPVPQPVPQQAKQADDPEPDPEDQKYAEGAYDRQYLKDQARWEARQEFKAERRRMAEAEEQVQRQQARQERYNGFRGRMDKAAEQQDFVDRLQKVKDNPAASRALVELLNATPWDEVPPGEHRGPQNLIAHSLVGSTFAPELTLYLVEHPDVYQRLVTLTPDELIREMARIEARIELDVQPPAATAGPARTAPAVSKAKPPLPPVRAMAQTAEVDQSELSNITDLDSYSRRVGFKGHKAGLR